MNEADYMAQAGQQAGGLVGMGRANSTQAPLMPTLDGALETLTKCEQVLTELSARILGPQIQEAKLREDDNGPRNMSLRITADGISRRATAIEHLLERLHSGL